MKLRRRGRRRSPAIAYSTTAPASPRPEPAPVSFFSTIISALLSLHPVPPARILRPSSPSATCRESNILQLFPSPAVPPLPFFFIKLLKRKSGKGRTVVGTQLTDPAVLLNDNRARPARPPPLPLRLIGWSWLHPSPNGILSVAGGAIGKQSMKINYLVSSPSLTNK